MIGQSLFRGRGLANEQLQWQKKAFYRSTDTLTLLIFTLLLISNHILLVFLSETPQYIRLSAFYKVCKADSPCCSVPVSGWNFNLSPHIRKPDYKINCVGAITRNTE